MRIALLVDRDDRVFRIEQNVFHRAVRCFPEGGVDGGDVTVLFGFDGQIHQRDVRCGDADGEAVDLALELWQHQMQRLCRAGAGRDHRHACRAPAPQVFVGQVEQLLVVGVGVDRGHDAVLDAKIIQQNFCHGSQTIGRAGGVGDDVVQFRIIGLVVDAQHDSDIRILRRRGNNDVLGSGREVFPCAFAVGKAPGRFDDDVHLQILPGKFLWVLHCKHLNGLAVDEDLVAFGLDASG